MILVSGNVTVWGFSWQGHQMRVGLSTMAIFGDLSGYFFGIFRDNASNIIWPVTDSKMNDLEWLFDVKIRFWTA